MLEIIKKLILKMKYTFLFLILPLSAFTQKSRLITADKLAEQQAYFDASKIYEDILSRGTDSMVVANKIARCYQKAGNSIKTNSWFDYLYAKNKLNQNELLEYALLKNQLGEYEQSLNLMNEYVQLYGENERTKNFFDEIMLQKKAATENEIFTIKELEINSSASEIAASYITDNQLIVTSSNDLNQKTNQAYSWTTDNFFQLYVGQIDSTGTIFNSNKIEGRDKQLFFYGPAVYDNTNEIVYFTGEDLLASKNGQIDKKRKHVKIYSAKLVNNRLEKIKELPFNNTHYSCAHPSISDDGRQLYFSSDMPGGFGGADIYVVSINENGTVGVPRNVGAKVNTSQNEFFPFFRLNEKILFFSTNGFEGFGGFDIFYAKFNEEGQVKSVDNIGKPINSYSDDFSFVNNSAQTQGYFTSNRVGGAGNEDVYLFNQLRPITNSKTLKGKVFDESKNSPIVHAIIYLSNKTGEIIDSTYSNATGEYVLSLKNGTEEVIVSAQAMGFNQIDTLFTNTKKKDFSCVNLNMSRKLNYSFIGLVVDKLTNEKLNDVKISIFETKTNKLVSTINSNIIGKFESAVFPELLFKDSINFTFKFEKKGYLTIKASLHYRLANMEKIDVTEILQLKLVKVTNGVTDLAEIIAIKPICFDYNQAVIRPDAAIELDKIVQIMLDNPKMIIALYSHTDSRGSSKLNENLSNLRAKSSIEYIISKGISAKRISGKGKGESELKVADEVIKKEHKWDKQEELHQINRRTEFIVVQLN
jgi:outer membrane protein OmpA-like peptidoglycan-associated protein